MMVDFPVLISLPVPMPEGVRIKTDFPFAGVPRASGADLNLERQFSISEIRDSLGERV